MIQLAGRTYRIVEVAHATYRAIRIADETEIGMFRCGRTVQLWSRSVTDAELGEVAKGAIMAGKTRWHQSAGPSSTLRAYASVALSVMIGLASCSGTPPAPAASSTSAPSEDAAPVERSAADARIELWSEPGQVIVVHRPPAASASATQVITMRD